MYLTKGMTCAKALRQEIFPVRKKVKGPGCCPAGHPTPLFEYLLLAAPEIMGRPSGRPCGNPGCQLEDSVMVAETGPSAALPA